MVGDSKNIGNHIIAFAKDDYNKAIGASLIDAKNDAQAISSFLLEFRDAPLTLLSYSKEIERLLLWCIHVAKLNISSLRRDHFTDKEQIEFDYPPTLTAQGNCKTAYPIS